MICLIAESKTMGINQWLATPELLDAHTPHFEFEADAIMASLRGLSVSELAARFAAGPKTASAMHAFIYDFPNKSVGYKALEAFTGVVFKALDVGSLTPDAKMRAGQKLRIVSSLYGWLKPDDIIKPYRFDYTDRAAPGDVCLNTFWRSKLNIQLINMIKQTGDSEVLNLLPLDASKCIDWKLVKSFASVYVANFKRQLPEGLKTPDAGTLKILRGKLLRQILLDDITSAQQLRDIDSDFCYYEADDPYPNHLLFLTD